jgi:hypothetical protein
MHGLRRRVEDETESTSKERNTDERGSLAKGAASALRGCGGVDREIGFKRLVAATDERELFVPLTNLLDWAAALSGRMEDAAFMAVLCEMGVVDI